MGGIGGSRAMTRFGKVASATALLALAGLASVAPAAAQAPQATVGAPPAPPLETGAIAAPTSPVVPPASTGSTPAQAAAAAARQSVSTAADGGSVSPFAEPISKALAALPTTTDQAETRDREALAAYHASHHAQPLWIGSDGVSDRALALAAEITNAAAYGLDAEAFPLPDLDGARTPEELASVEVALSLAALKYAYHARGGRIPEPAQMLNSNLDRKPQLHDAIDVLEKLAASDDVARTLASLHPVHPQFELLRQAFLAEATDGKGGGKLSPKAKRIRANMEFWRWMWDDLGALHVFNNIPEYMQYVVRDGEVIRKERIVVGEISKQSSVFSRPLKEVVLRPRWRVPDSIMVHELWPSLLKGGGLMRSYGLEITTKSGEPRDWRAIDWSKDDIRNYHVWQPPGRKSVLGFVKFSFPSQHTIFMHDTPDKWMFAKSQRTLSHGCLRVKNPMELTEIVLDYDRGWDRDRIEQLLRSGPLDNAIVLTKTVPIHLAYFTARVEDDGKLRFFRDIYGHEKRVTQALDGDWKKIDKGRDHLAPVKPRFDPDQVARQAPRRQRETTSGGDSVSDMISDALGSLF